MIINRILPISYFIYAIYTNCKIIIIITIFLGAFLLILASYKLFFNNFGILLKINNIVIKIIKKIYNLFKKLIITKVFKILFFLVFFSLIIYINTFFISKETTFLLIIFTLFLGYLIFSIQLFFFCMGIPYYQIKNDKQNFFLSAIIVSSALAAVMLIIGGIWVTVYLLASRIVSSLTFFNLIIIQNTYFKEFIEKRKKYLMCIIVLIFILGVFVSLRTLTYG